ncbi:MAG: D-alanyl-D-alanine carboxypeptidase family protein [Clostridia bacterium]|nr:D-alanyl-D-alanine carboxypeptidase family protein [Clostridia bacterium]
MIKQCIYRIGVGILILFLFFTLSVVGSARCADADGDGILSVADARIALRIAVRLDIPTEEQQKDCDLDRDGAITPADAREILRLSVGFGRSDDSANSGMPDAEFIGLTDNYYKVYNKNGVTYIDSIIIANKTYALPDDYDTNGLVNECRDAFAALQTAAKKDGVNIYLNSGFRPYSEQKELYDEYVRDYGTDYADAYAARPGHSEHQTGLAIDVTNDTGYFTGSPEAQWLHANCVQYGFILRYPEGKSDKTGYSPEAWHIRFVGTEKAAKLNGSGLCLEEYYGITSFYFQQTDQPPILF